MRNVPAMLPVGLLAGALATAAPASVLGVNVQVTRDGVSKAAIGQSATTGPLEVVETNADVLYRARADYGVLKAAFNGGVSQNAPTVINGATFYDPYPHSQNVWVSANFNDSITLKPDAALPQGPDWVTTTANFSIDSAFNTIRTGRANYGLNALVRFEISSNSSSDRAWIEVSRYESAYPNMSPFVSLGLRQGGSWNGMLLPVPSAPPLAQLNGDYAWSFRMKPAETYSINASVECRGNQYTQPSNAPVQGSIAQSCDLGNSVYWQGITKVANAYGNSIGFSTTSGSGFDYGRAWNDQPPPAAVPEPAAWAMLILGFGLTGLAARRRTRGTPRRANS